MSGIGCYIIFFVDKVGNSEIKFIVTRSHFHLGIEMGCKKPDGTLCSALTLWHIKHLVTHPVHFILDHQYHYRKSWHIFIPFRCKANEPSWASWYSISSTPTWSWNHKQPSSLMLKSSIHFVQPIFFYWPI